MLARKKKIEIKKNEKPLEWKWSNVHRKIWKRHQTALQSLGINITKGKNGEEGNYIFFTTNMTACLLQRVSEKQCVSFPFKQVFKIIRIVIQSNRIVKGYLEWLSIFKSESVSSESIKIAILKYLGTCL